MNSPDKSGMEQIFASKKISRPPFLAKFQMLFTNCPLNVVAAVGSGVSILLRGKDLKVYGQG